MSDVVTYGEKARGRIADAVTFTEEFRLHPDNQRRYGFQIFNPGQLLLPCVTGPEDGTQKEYAGEDTGAKSDYCPPKYPRLVPIGMPHMAMAKAAGTISASAANWSTLGSGRASIVAPNANFQGRMLDAQQRANDNGEPVVDFVDTMGVDAPADAEGSADARIKLGLEVMVINPGCTTISSGTPLLLHQELRGNWVIIFEMCPC